ncbi:MAG: penicillin-binding protein 1B [Kangiellaceae bacterium]|nr:penicillin-binding protein 1B [Kangiellaceae bacterium]
MSFVKKTKSFLFRLILIGAIGFLFLVIYLDSKVSSEFQQQAWDIPAKVYARSLSFSLDKNLTIEDLIQELNLLGYRQKIKALSSGEFEVYQQTFVIKTRGFKFWDGEQESRTIQLSIGNNRVKSLTDFSTNTAINYLRLDPLLLGNIQVSNLTRMQDRQLIKLEDLPEHFINALLAVEDRDFFQHWGLSIRGIARAAWSNIKGGKITQGGSTLTQQLIKNHFLSNERSLWRKTNEAVMALLTEYHYDKETILQSYINEVYLGQNANIAIHGFSRASEFYFDQKLSELNLSQAALLIGLVKGPSLYNPRRQPTRATERRDLVLAQMLEQGVITRARYNLALSRSLMVVSKPPTKISRVPALMGLVKRELASDYDSNAIKKDGLKLFTSLDPIVQKKAEHALKSRIEKLDGRTANSQSREQLQGAVIVSDIVSGEIKAIVGDRNPNFAGFNRAIDAYRQTGSIIKPAVYLAALQQPDNFNWMTPILDTKFSLKGSDGSVWRPQNYDKEEHGDKDSLVPLAEGLINSYNLATARLAMKVGIDEVVDIIHELGFERALPAYPSIALGSKEMSPLEVSRLYQVIANSGESVTPQVLIAVQAQNGRLLKRYTKTSQQVIEREAAVILRYLLNQVTKRGTAKSLSWSFPNMELAGKTGTTNDLKDSWFAGFDGEYLAVVWLGKDNNQPTGLTGSSGALRVWADLFEQLGPKPVELSIPENVSLAYEEGGFFSELTSCTAKKLVPFYSDFIPEGYRTCQ